MQASGRTDPGQVSTVFGVPVLLMAEKISRCIPNTIISDFLQAFLEKKAIQGWIFKGGCLLVMRFILKGVFLWQKN